MGVGDALMAVGEVKELKKKNPNAIFIIGDGNRSYWNEVFDNNPNIIKEPKGSEYNKLIWVKNYEGNRPYRNYGDKFPKDKYNWKKYKALKGEFYFTKEEVTIAEKVITAVRKKINHKKLIFIEPHVKKRLGYENKDWGFNNWEKIVDELKSEYAFYKLHMQKENQLEKL